MTLANDLHNESMRYADEAIFAQRHGDDEGARGLFAQALKSELDAIEDFVARMGTLEPSYSVLHRSAATLAVNCGKLRDAEKLAAKALAREPHPEIAEELRDVMTRATFHRHLELKGVELSSESVQMSLAGDEVGLGEADQQELWPRVRDALQMMRRIADRRQGKPFRETGRPPKDAYRLFTSVPRAASCAVTLRLATKQYEFPGMHGADAVIDEFVELIELLNASRADDVQRLIPDTAYLRNFVALGKRLAPDGERVRLVGFTTTREGRERFAQLTRRASEIPTALSGEVQDSTPKQQELTGLLQFADATSGAKKIRLVDAGKRSALITVPEGMLDDIVRPMWGTYVRVVGIPKGKGLTLVDIDPVDPPRDDSGE